MKPSDTPRTNANEHECIEAGDFVYSSFARQLERDLNEANTTIGALKCHTEEMLYFIECSKQKEWVQNPAFVTATHTVEIHVAGGETISPQS